MNTGVSGELVDRINRLRDDEGLFDVKLLLQNKDEATFEGVCGELVAVLDAFQAGKSAPIDFGPPRWKD
jgi:hypothetical protein